MPKVQITETYKYGSSALDLSNFAVYIPVLAIDKPVDPVLYKSYKDLYLANYGQKAGEINWNDVKLYDDSKMQYAIVRKLLEKGLPVLVEGVKVKQTASVIDNIYNFTSYPTGSYEEPYATGQVVVEEEVTFNETDYYKVKVTANTIEGFEGKEYYIDANATVGDNKYTLYELDEDGTPVATQIDVTIDNLIYTPGNNIPDIKSWDKIVDKALYNIRFISFAGWDVDNELVTKAIECASARKDCIVLLDDPKTLNSDTKDTNINIIVNPIYKDSVSDQVGKVRTYFEQFSFLENDKLKNAAAFTPWINVYLNKLEKTTNTVKDVVDEFTVPASFGYLSTFATSIKTNPEWFANAGSFRGIIEELVDNTAVTYTYTSAEVELLQGRSKTYVVDLNSPNDNIGMGINPISKIIPFGYMINGNRTLYIGTVEEDNRPNFRALLSIRNLVATIAKTLYVASKKYTFEPNSDITYINFKSEITPILDKMRSGLGIRGYKFERIATTAKGRISARITIKPIEPCEDFDLYIELDDSVDIIE